MSETKPEYRIEGRPSTIFRVKHDPDNPYVVINMNPVLNTKLSWKAKGILVYLLSRPDGWEVNLVDLTNRSADGLSAVKSGCKELKEAGHLKHAGIRRESGQFETVVWEVYEAPQVDNQLADEPQVGVSPEVDFPSPEVDYPHVDKPHADNRTQVLKNLSSKDFKESTTIKEITKKVFTAYENEIGLITPHVRDTICDYLDDLKIPPEWIIDAIHIAREQQKPSWAYCAAILKRWAVEGKTAQTPKATPSGPKYPGRMTPDQRQAANFANIEAGMRLARERGVFDGN